MKKILVQHLMLLVLGMNFLPGCLVAQGQRIVSKPIIKESTSWKMVEDCGYERCGPPLVDFLTGPDLTIRTEAHNDLRDNTFAILLEFIPKDKDQFKFNPSFVTVTLANRGTLTGEAFFCSGLNWDPKHRQSVAPLKGDIPLEPYKCFLFFFEPPPPTVEEEFVMRIEGVTKQGQKYPIPEVIFRKGIQQW